jgi:methylated-DNA-[protein]-cysteine S-methyltransferase
MPVMSTIRYCHMQSPIGPLLLAGSDEALRVVSFPSGRGARRPKPEWIEDATAFRETIRQLGEYFAGERTAFELPLEPHGNEFQLRVWQALRQIPYGATATYGEIATAIGEPLSASRAVGSANGANPLPIVIPCHRVIGAGGALVGFGGGLATKKFLLDLEFRVCPPKDTLFALM